MKKHASIESYLKACTPKQRAALTRLRKAIKAQVPGVYERVSYGVPYYSIPGRGFVTAFAARRKQGDLSLYATHGPIKELAKELKSYDISGATIHFTPAHPISAALLRKVIRIRLRLLAAKKKRRRL